MNKSNKSYLCNACGWVYDPTQGDPDGSIAPGTPWEDIPDDWICPVCGSGKEDFEPIEEPPSSTPAEQPEVAPLVIVGSGLAGYAVVKELRKRDVQRPIVMVTADGGEVYSKPMLSNAIARGHEPNAMVQKEAAAMARDLGLEIRVRTRVTSIDRRTRTLTTEHLGVSETLAYGTLVLALGADPRIFPAEGSDAVDIATVNDLDDYRRWRHRIGSGGRILLIGAGLIGCEFANDLTLGGFEVAMVDPAPWPLARLLPAAMGRMLVRALEQAGCRLYMGRTVARYVSAESGFIAELDDGSRVAFDHALSAVGLTPRTRLAADAELRVQVGILVDRWLRTNDRFIHAIGDCAQTEAGPLPYIAPLLAQARALAATLAGEQTSLQLPAMPVVVKTPALPLVVCPPPPGSEGAWELDMGEDEGVAIFRTADGAEVGFALAGGKTNQQRATAQRMPDLLPAAPVEAEAAASESTADQAGRRYTCDVCGYVYDPKEGDPDGGIPPGTAWDDIPDDWVCPVCGAGKDQFTQTV